MLACSSEPADPETQIRSRIRAREEASRDKDFPALKYAVSEAYADKAGHTAADIHNLMRGRYLRAKSVYVLTKIEQLEWLADRKEQLTILAAMAATPVGEAAALKNVCTDVYRFDADMAKEDDTSRITRAAWRPADLKDFY